MNEQKQPQGKLLTAEEILLNYFPQSIICQMPDTKSKTVQAMEDYAAQEAAALREELDKEKAMRLSQGVYVQQLKDELEQYKAALSDMTSEAKANFDFAQSEKNLREQAERIYNTEHAELEAVKNERNALNIRVRSTTNALIHAGNAPFMDIATLRVFIKKFLSDITCPIPGIIDAFEVTRQRDEALDIASELLSQLKYVQEKFIQTGSTPGVITQCETRLSRLSSGETKPVSQWISVEDRLPERPNTTPNRFSQRVWVGNPKQEIKLEESDNYDFDLGRWHRYGSRVKFWMPISPLPAPPESLTDKSKV